MWSLFWFIKSLSIKEVKQKKTIFTLVAIVISQFRWFVWWKKRRIISMVGVTQCVRQKTKCWGSNWAPAWMHNVSDTKRKTRDTSDYIEKLYTILCVWAPPPPRPSALSSPSLLLMLLPSMNSIWAKSAFAHSYACLTRPILYSRVSHFAKFTKEKTLRRPKIVLSSFLFFWLVILA